MTAPKDTLSKMANKVHIELRAAQVGVSVLDHDSAGKFIAIKYEVGSMELDGTYNGAFEELTVAQANHRIEQLQRGVRLIERADKAESGADDRFKNNGYIKTDGAFDEPVNLRAATSGGKTPTHRPHS